VAPFVLRVLPLYLFHRLRVVDLQLGEEPTKGKLNIISIIIEKAVV
jgi:hypothetical protein